jgi:hypothetical protein
MKRKELLRFRKEYVIVLVAILLIINLIVYRGKYPYSDKVKRGVVEQTQDSIFPMFPVFDVIVGLNCSECTGDYYEKGACYEKIENEVISIFRSEFRFARHVEPGTLKSSCAFQCFVTIDGLRKLDNYDKVERIENNRVVSSVH